VFWAFPFEQGREFGGRRLRSDFAGIDLDLPADIKAGAPAASNTTIAVVATNADFSRTELRRIAIMASDGFARAIRPVHAPTDGDTVFAVTTGAQAVAEPRWLHVMRAGSLAADCLARAIARGVHAADTLGGIKSWRETFSR
jgi:L-aminopeptidase/D-esterase-like protein